MNEQPTKRPYKKAPLPPTYRGHKRLRQERNSSGYGTHAVCEVHCSECGVALERAASSILMSEKRHSGRFKCSNSCPGRNPQHVMWFGFLGKNQTIYEFARFKNGINLASGIRVTRARSESEAFDIALNVEFRENNGYTRDIRLKRVLTAGEAYDEHEKSKVTQ